MNAKATFLFFNPDKSGYWYEQLNR